MNSNYSDVVMQDSEFYSSKDSNKETQQRYARGSRIEIQNFYERMEEIPKTLKHVTEWDIHHFTDKNFVEYAKHYCINADLHLDEMQRRRMTGRKYYEINKLRNMLMSMHGIDESDLFRVDFDYGKVVGLEFMVLVNESV